MIHFHQDCFTLKPVTLPMISLLNQAAHHHPDAVALVTAQGQLTYRDYYHRVLQTAVKLENMGLKPSDPLPFIADNSLESIILMMAVWEIGAIAVPLSPRFPLAQIERSLKHLRCSRLVVPQREGFEALEPDLLHEVVANENDGALVETSPPRQFPLDRRATILFTSGTTQRPKAVVHSLGNHYYSAVGANQNIDFAPGDRWLLSLPIYHVGGLAILVRALVGGAAVGLAELKQSSPNAFKPFGISHLSVVPTQLYRLMHDEALVEWLQGLKAILIGGSGIPSALIHKAIQQRLPIHTTYGSTEMSSQTTTTCPHESPERLLTAGRLLPHRALKIAADGQILVKGKTLFQGYLASDGTITSAIDAAGWFATGDIGSLDEAGYLTVLGRKDNMFISGGENICPEEIETVLQSMSGLVKAMVVPVKSVEFGARPVAFVQTESGRFSQAAIRTHLEQKLPRFKIPDRFFDWPDLDRPEPFKYNRHEFIMLAEERLKNLS